MDCSFLFSGAVGGLVYAALTARTPDAAAHPDSLADESDPSEISTGALAEL